MSNLSPEFYQPVLYMALFLLSTAFAVIAYFLKRLDAAVNRKEQEQDKKIEELGKQINDLEVSLPRIYVLRDDFIRAISGLDGKIDNISREITNLIKLVGGSK